MHVLPVQRLQALRRATNKMGYERTAYLALAATAVPSGSEPIKAQTCANWSCRPLSKEIWKMCRTMLQDPVNDTILRDVHVNCRVFGEIIQTWVKAKVIFVMSISESICRYVTYLPAAALAYPRCSRRKAWRSPMEWMDVAWLSMMPKNRLDMVGSDWHDGRCRHMQTAHPWGLHGSCEANRGLKTDLDWEALFSSMILHFILI